MKFASIINLAVKIPFPSDLYQTTVMQDMSGFRDAFANALNLYLGISPLRVANIQVKSRGYKKLQNLPKSDLSEKIYLNNK